MKKFIIIGFVVLILLSVTLYVRAVLVDSEVIPALVEHSATPRAATSVPSPGSAAANLPKSVSLDVPFQVQAPNANWDEVHEEACEEASLIMVRHFLNKTVIASPDQAEQEIQELIREETNRGYAVDVTTAELRDIAKTVYGLKTGRVEKATVTKIKQELAAGRPVIIPAAGRLLPNPNFRQPGPIYHMLVVKGYDSEGFITNDPGTRNGNSFRYSEEDLYFAIHDWDASNIEKGPRNYLVFD